MLLFQNKSPTVLHFHTHRKSAARLTLCMQHIIEAFDSTLIEAIVHLFQV